MAKVTCEHSGVSWETNNGWISIKNNLPTINVLVLMTGDDEVIPGFYSSMSEWCEVGGLETALDITHWQYFPEPPND